MRVSGLHKPGPQLVCPGVVYSHSDMFLGQLAPPEAIPVVYLVSDSVFLFIEFHLNVHLAALFVICLVCACKVTGAYIQQLGAFI